jgi:hypothetical protein
MTTDEENRAEIARHTRTAWKRLAAHDYYGFAKYAERVTLLRDIHHIPAQPSPFADLVQLARAKIEAMEKSNGQ